MAYSKVEKKLIKDLKALKVELTGEETSEQLLVLAKENNLTEDDPNANATILDVAEAKVGVRFIDPVKGEIVREFSVTDHGEDFKTPAKQLADKMSGTYVQLE